MTASRLIFLRSVAASMFVLFCALLTGCGSKGPTLYPVSGKVTGADGKPLEHASVVFHPVGASDPNFVKPHGKTAADGTFQLTTHTTGDGAPTGEYQVTIELWLAGNKPDDPPANRLATKYGKPDTSGFKATVNAGPTELTPFEVKR